MWNWNTGGYLPNDMSVEGPPRSPDTPLFQGGDASHYTYYDEDSCQPPNGDRDRMLCDAPGPCCNASCRRSTISAAQAAVDLSCLPQVCVSSRPRPPLINSGVCVGGRHVLSVCGRLFGEWSRGLASRWGIQDSGCFHLVRANALVRVHGRHVAQKALARCVRDLNRIRCILSGLSV